MNRELPFDGAHHLRHCMFRRNRDHHMHVLTQQMPFFHAAFILHRQLVEDLSESPIAVSPFVCLAAHDSKSA